MAFKLPKDSHRTAIMGRTGSGKTALSLFVLSRANFEDKPYYIVDYKGDDHIAQLDRAKEIGLNETPRHPGLYIVRPLPHETEAMEQWLWRVYEQGGTGLYFDEAYMVPDDGAFPAILTQGRSKRINSIIVTQRPAWISRFVFSEANQFASFHLNDADDRKKLWRFLPPDKIVRKRLPDYHSVWYDVDNNALSLLSPCPHPDASVDMIQSRLQPRRVAI
jgi:DNA helicase HerA-like ATPase